MFGDGVRVEYFYDRVAKNFVFYGELTNRECIAIVFLSYYVILTIKLEFIIEKCRRVLKSKIIKI